MGVTEVAADTDSGGGDTVVVIDAEENAEGTGEYLEVAEPLTEQGTSGEAVVSTLTL